MKKLVLAANFEEFTYAQRMYPDTLKDATFISTTMTLYGYRGSDVEIYSYGRAYLNPHYDELMAEIKYIRGGEIKYL